MPGEISRAYQPPNTPEWRAVKRELARYMKQLERERKEREKQDKQAEEEPLPW